MYESFFGFQEKPFNITPDPKYLYLSYQHQEAIAHLHYGIEQRGGFVVITGEIGTGKTTLCRHLLNHMDDRTEGAIILNPNLSGIELLKAINSDFGIDSSAKTKKELIDELNRFLLEERMRGKNMVLIIDEAQNLMPAVLEQIRMLSNIETEKEKLIQIILIGQPQLKKLLARPELEQLSQRVTARYHLNSLNLKETCRYIQHRLDVAAGATGAVAFEPAAMKAVYRFSKGTPRLINVVCDRALLGAFTAGRQSPISKKIVKIAVGEVAGPKLSFSDRFSFDGPRAKVFILSFALLLAVIAGWVGSASFSGLRPSRGQAGGVDMIPDGPANGERTLAEASLPERAGSEALAATIAVYGADRNEILASAPLGSSPEPAAAMLSNAAASIRRVPYTTEEKNGLVDALLLESYEESRMSAARNLLSLWGKRPDLTLEQASSFHGLALSQNVRCTEMLANLEGLRAANLPCMLEMFIPQELKPRYAVLAGLDGGTGKLLYADGRELEAPLELLDEFWLRRAFIFWRDYEPLGEVIRYGHYGAPVIWLQEALKSEKIFDGEMSGIFDKATEEAVRRFQGENSLLLDGVVGPKTRLVLYSHLERYPMPHLDSMSHEHNTQSP